MLFQGIIEKDDIEFGYCKVRIFGIHTENKTDLPTDDLPNAKILYNAESNIDQISYFKTITNGTHVIVDFLDEDQQKPIILGSVVKDVETLPDFTQGFSDPNSEHPSILENTISRLARNENISNTIVQTKINDRETGISCVDETFDEPANEYNTVYPNNRVLQTKKHIIELDDTEGAERINIYHNSGSFIEFNPDGTILEKCKGEKFLSITDDLNIIVRGNCNIASEGNINLDATSINLNGTTDNLVSWDDMNTIWEYMVDRYNTHTHPGVETGSGTTGVTTIQIVSPNTTLDSAKVDSVKIP